MVKKTKKAITGGTKMENLENLNAVIKVFGLGGGGTNAINHMINNKSCVNDVEFFAINTDAQHLKQSVVPEANKILIGLNNGRKLGLGAGAKPEVGKKAAEENRDRIEAALQGADLVFLAAGMGGGSGTGIAPVIAQMARDMGILTVAVVTLPFEWEGRKRMNAAISGRGILMESAHTVITVRNDSLNTYLEDEGKTDLGFLEAFKEVDRVLDDAVSGLVNIITEEGNMNLDFSDVETVLQLEGSSLMGIGYGEGQNRVQDATYRAIQNPLLEHDIRGAMGVILSVTGGEDLKYTEVSEVGRIVEELVDPDATVITGATINPAAPKGSIRVTLIATGFQNVAVEPAQPAKKPQVDFMQKKPTLNQAPNRNVANPQQIGDIRSRLANIDNQFNQRVGNQTDEPMPSWVNRRDREQN